MSAIKITFPNQTGQQLSALLDLSDSKPACYALFAHCFTCSKDLTAASVISKGLLDNGIAVLRFDFTGIGNSEGDFANTNFSSNILDLVAAAQFLQQNYAPPAMLIGHSLGGAAVLAVARIIESVKAVVTIGAPATARHLQHLFSGIKSTLAEQDMAEVTLGGKTFNITGQFLQDLETYNTVEHISNLDKALLVCHSPLDEIVSIDEAASIYIAARHPKSFISLDDADHLLSDRRDAIYVSDVIASWSSRYVQANISVETAIAPREVTPLPGQVLVTEQNRQFTRHVYTTSHHLLADEPLIAGGANTGPNPYEFLLTALGACTSMTVRMYANRKDIKLDNIEVTLKHSRIHADDCENCQNKEGMVDMLEKHILLEGDLSDQERTKLVEIAGKCPVHKTLLNEIVINTKIL